MIINSYNVLILYILYEQITKNQGLSKVFGAFKAVDNLTFNLDKGEVFGFLGPNGAGKTPR